MRLCFLGEHEYVRRDPVKLLDGLRVKYPRLKEHELLEVARTILEGRPARADCYIKVLLGRDVGTADVRTIPAWPLLSETEKTRLPAETPAQRLARVWPQGLAQTYVFRRSNRFTQDVAPADVEVIRRSPARHWFARADGNGRPVRSFDFPVKEAIPFSDALEAKRYERSFQRVQRWTGR